MRPRDFQHVHFRLKLGEPRELHVQVASVLVDAFEQNIQEDAKAPIGPALTHERSGFLNHVRFRHRELPPSKFNEDEVAFRSIGRPPAVR